MRASAAEQVHWEEERCFTLCLEVSWGKIAVLNDHAESVECAPPFAIQMSAQSNCFWTSSTLLAAI
jgi:hypothetical protein